jgi:hypothetical protein
MNNDKEIMIENVSNKLLYQIIFAEKKNSNTNELKDSDMIKEIKKLIEKEVPKNDIQTNETE